LNRRELVLALAERTDTDRRTADEMLSAFVDVVTENVAKGEPVAISGFAKFARVDRPARMGRNPQTGETIRIKPSRRVRVTALKAFKDAAMSGRVAKKAPARKTTAKRSATSKGGTAKRSPAKKTTAKRATTRR
jgi:DNA-binding protein HU-beta